MRRRERVTRSSLCRGCERSANMPDATRRQSRRRAASSSPRYAVQWGASSRGSGTCAHDPPVGSAAPVGGVSCGRCRDVSRRSLARRASAGVRSDAAEGWGGEAAWSVREGSGDYDQKSRDSGCVLAPSHRIGASRLRTGRTDECQRLRQRSVSAAPNPSDRAVSCRIPRPPRGLRTAVSAANRCLLGSTPRGLVNRGSPVRVRSPAYEEQPADWWLLSPVPADQSTSN
jgi:hypothetical protein